MFEDIETHKKLSKWIIGTFKACILIYLGIRHISGSVKFHYLFLLLNLDFMGVCNKKSIDLPFSGIMSIAKPTLNQGDNAHGHYTVFTSLNSIPT